MPVAEGVLNYLIGGIEGTPVVLATLLRGIEFNDPRWDARPHADRFTLREMVAHMADWDAIFVTRVERARDEDHPFLESIDEGQLCAERDYASQDPAHNLKRLRQSRSELVALLRSLPAEAWDRTATREFIGNVRMDQLVTTILGHDAYHTRQAAEFALSPV